MNKLIIIGNLTGNPQSRIVNTDNGVKCVCSFTVAVNRTVRGERTAEYFRVSCWGKQAENAMKYLEKGRSVAVLGAVSARAYISGDGNPRASLEVSADEIKYIGATREAGAIRGDEFRNAGDDEMPF